jgi:hypothetical protein
MGKSKTDYSKIDYSKQYERLSDKEISEILKRRKEYQEVAAEAAIKEAIKRGIINSEQDLFAEKYRHEPLKVSLFPRIENEESRRKMRKSLTRSLLFLGVILIAWGAWSIFNHNLAEGIGFVIAGIIWNIISFSFFKNVNKKNVNLLIVIQFIAAIYAVIKLSAYKNLPFMDVFIVIFLFGFVMYGLFYLKMLND